MIKDNAGFLPVSRTAFRDLLKRFVPVQRPAAAAFWIEALMRANWRDGDNVASRDALALKRGQFVYGRDELAEQLGVSVQSLRSTIKRFVQIRELATISTNRGTVGTVLRYGVFVVDRPGSNQQNNQGPTRNQPAANHTEQTEQAIQTKKQQLRTEVDPSSVAPTDGDVVVALSEAKRKPDPEALAALNSVGVSPGKAESLATQYGPGRIREVIDHAKTLKNLQNLPAFIIKALEEQYKFKNGQASDEAIWEKHVKTQKNLFHERHDHKRSGGVDVDARWRKKEAELRGKYDAGEINIEGIRMKVK